MPNFCFIIFFVILFFAPNISGADPKSAEPKITERIIKIKGTVDKPRVIFIVPRAKLWKKSIFGKDYIQDILKPVYPESLIKELGSYNPKKR